MPRVSRSAPPPRTHLPQQAHAPERAGGDRRSGAGRLVGVQTKSAVPAAEAAPDAIGPLAALHVLCVGEHSARTRHDRQMSLTGRVSTPRSGATRGWGALGRRRRASRRAGGRAPRGMGGRKRAAGRSMRVTTSGTAATIPSRGTADGSGQGRPGPKAPSQPRTTRAGRDLPGDKRLVTTDSDIAPRPGVTPGPVGALIRGGMPRSAYFRGVGRRGDRGGPRATE
jgi:hypothetical protein